MSRRREIVGQDDRGRPISRWEDVPDPAPEYGFMQPAYDTTVERRFVDPDPAAAGVTAGPHQVDLQTPEQARASRRRGQAAMRASSRPDPAPEEDPPAMEAPQPPEEPLPHSVFTDLAAAALEAATRQQEAQAARLAAQVAEERLAAARADLEAIWASAGLAVDGQPLLAAVPDPEPLPIASTTARTAPRPQRTPLQPSGLTARQAQVLQAVVDASGGISAAAKALRTSEANVRVTLHSIGKKGLLDAEAIAMLPDSWARYAAPTVAA